MGWDQNYNNDDKNERTFPKKKTMEGLKSLIWKKGTIYVILTRYADQKCNRAEN